jgi:hypothetical protein
MVGLEGNGKGCGQQGIICYNSPKWHGREHEGFRKYGLRIMLGSGEDRDLGASVVSPLEPYLPLTVLLGFPSNDKCITIIYVEGTSNWITTHNSASICSYQRANFNQDLWVKAAYTWCKAPWGPGYNCKLEISNHQYQKPKVLFY